MRLSKRVVLLLIIPLLLSACQPLVQDSRPHDQVLTYELTDTLTSAFFTLEIGNFEATRNLNDYVPEDRQAIFLALDLTIENTTKDSLPMSYADFRLVYKDTSGKEQFLYPLQNFLENQLPDTFTLKKDESQSGLLVFQIPKNLKECQFLYEEVYEDDFIGNRHLITIVLTN